MRPLLPIAKCQRAEGETVDRKNRLVVILVTSSCPACNCPVCSASSKRMHRRYLRTLADLPWRGIQVVIRWRSRRFLCRNPSCQRNIVTERLPDVAARGAPFTVLVVHFNHDLTIVPDNNDAAATFLDELSVSSSSCRTGRGNSCSRSSCDGIYSRARS